MLSEIIGIKLLITLLGSFSDNSLIAISRGRNRFLLTKVLTLARRLFVRAIVSSFFLLSSSIDEKIAL
jgi:uncharacterized protein with PIN domain